MVILTAAVIFAHAAVFAQQPVTTNDAKNTVEKWLKLMDSGEYETCYSMLSSVYIDSIKKGSPKAPKSYWVRNMGSARGELGANESRQVFRMTPARELKSSRGSSRRGSFIIFDIRSSFANRPDTIETVSVQHEGGAWKISSYIF